MARHARTLVLGEALVDIVHGVDGSVTSHPGGSPLNVAIGLARLDHPVELASYIADDEHGAAIVRHLEADGVPLADGSVSASRTPTATATLDQSGSATYDFDLSWAVSTLPTAYEHLHTGSIAAVLQPGASGVREAMEQARTHATVSYDPNARPSLMGDPHEIRSDIEQLVGFSDVVKASDEDIRWLYGDDAPLTEILRLWSQLGPPLVVMTRGGDGALAHLDTESDVIEVPGLTVEVADTVGAGDSFMSGLISGLLDAGLLGGPDARARLRTAHADDVRPALDRAARASAITVSRAGAQPPTRAEL
ncbi:carbohydrate kinase family protein [Luteipulveratus mongoliensis]|uniref:Kinase n=1 Tax=Luteipulveratus mongoliensis TaxID=571913 RepID=A0A0K1JLX4_9MICO|nr:carbohydrate kinase [Luteipulveratus mongoliensis]AKU17706.1 kinase [Luteipulveratus mongoliensis]